MNRASINPEFWKGKRVLLTGHTGFKGGWLSLWLQSMGATVMGYALAPPTRPALFEVARIAAGMSSRIADIRDLATLKSCLHGFRPDIVIHMAAQPLVRLSYREPVETYATNVMGTVHVLEAVRTCPGVRAVINVTTDKCYENREWVWGYRENDPMGGHDPYSSSKGCAELVTAAYRHSFFCGQGNAALASARAGNVIGGGDWADDRLIPDILRAFDAGRPVVIRHPQAIRPWQHVLEPLAGYLVLAERLWSDGHAVAESWNFGPEEQDARPVRWIVEHLVADWGMTASWQIDGSEHLHEADHLRLDCSRARVRLHWRPVWPLATALRRIVNWHWAWRAGNDMQAYCLREITDYTNAMSRLD
ncbi:MAG: CDP-glucose 4,6-dehydratase [Pseudomonadota bacterium]